MMKFLCGLAFGIFLATAGTSGVAMFIDNGVNKFQNTIKENVRDQNLRTNQQLKYMEKL
jgi:hypothetical protein